MRPRLSIPLTFVSFPNVFVGNPVRAYASQPLRPWNSFTVLIFMLGNLFKRSFTALTFVIIPQSIKIYPTNQRTKPAANPTRHKIHPLKTKVDPKDVILCTCHFMQDFSYKSLIFNAHRSGFLLKTVQIHFTNAHI